MNRNQNKKTLGKNKYKLEKNKNKKIYEKQKHMNKCKNKIKRDRIKNE